MFGFPMDFVFPLITAPLEQFEKKVKKQIYNANKTATRESIRAFIREVALRVRVDTGMSKGSLLPLARAARLASGITINKKHKSKPGYTDLNGVYHPVPARRYQYLGELIGKGAYELDWGSIETQRIVFHYEIKVYQWAYHENAWQAMDAGIAAFESMWGPLFDENLPVILKSNASFLDWLRMAQ